MNRRIVAIIIFITKQLAASMSKKQKALAIDKQDKFNFIAVSTCDWEALGFYKKLGFYVEFERKGFDKNPIFYFLRKDLI